MYPEPHNTYLLLLVDTGIFGLVAYLAVLVSLFMFGVKAYQSHQSSSRMVIAIGLISMLCAILLVQQVDDLIAVDVAFTYFWFYAGIAYTLLKKGESHDGVSQSIGHYPDTQSGTIH
jgi:O-antigen ligase